MKIVISFDFELAWGVADTSEWLKRESSGLYEACHAELPSYIQLLQDLSVPATWAVVSNLLHRNSDDIKTDHLEGKYRQGIEEFIRSCSPKSRCAYELVERIASYTANEIATHTATHPYPSHPDVNVESYVADVECSVSDLNAVLDIKPKNIIYPRDDASFHRAVCTELGLGARVNPSNIIGHSGSTLFKYCREQISGPPQSHIFMGPSGEVLQSGSLLFNWYGGRASHIKRYHLRSMLRRILKTAEMGQSDSSADVYHLWLHPFNLLRDRAVGEQFKSFIDLAAKLQREGRLQFVTMDKLCNIALEESVLHKKHREIA